LPVQEQRRGRGREKEDEEEENEGRGERKEIGKKKEEEEEKEHEEACMEPTCVARNHSTAWHRFPDNRNTYSVALPCQPLGKQ